MKDSTKKEYEQLAETARELLSAMIKMGYSCQDLEKELDGRMSYRTLYRWLNKDSTPKRKNDVAALAMLYKRLKDRESSK